MHICSTSSCEAIAQARIKCQNFYHAIIFQISTFLQQFSSTHSYTHTQNALTMKLRLYEVREQARTSLFCGWKNFFSHEHW